MAGGRDVAHPGQGVVAFRQHAQAGVVVRGGRGGAGLALFGAATAAATRATALSPLALGLGRLEQVGKRVADRLYKAPEALALGGQVLLADDDEAGARGPGGRGGLGVGGVLLFSFFFLTRRRRRRRLAGLHSVLVRVARLALLLRRRDERHVKGADLVDGGDVVGGLGGQGGAGQEHDAAPLQDGGRAPAALGAVGGRGVQVRAQGAVQGGWRGRLGL